MLGSMRLAERVQFFRELATLVDAGMSLGMALSTLEGRRTSMELKLATQEAARKVSSGQRLSDVMARHPRVFSELNRALVAAGEQGGRLDDMLNLSADYLERELEFHQTLSRETFYPKLVAGAVLFIPLITRMVITAITGSMGQALAVGLVGLAWYTLILGLPIVVVYVLVQRYGASRQGRIGLDRLKQRTRVVAVLDTLEYLRRGGRLTRISATLGQILSIRPVIQVFDNRLEQLARTRHRENSLRRLLEIAQTHAPFDRLVVLHTAAAEVADWFATRLAHLNFGAKPAIIEAGSVIGTHVGPGAIGFACITRR